eukprot:COSAG05_NODE_790_length_7320_cov_14.861654_4_plen_394_part_00
MDGNGYMDLGEMKVMAAARFPGEEWDDGLWAPMCEDCGADPALGLNLQQFMGFDAAIREQIAERIAEETPRMIAEYDVDQDGCLNLEEARNWSNGLTVTKSDEWDDALWPTMCESYGVAPEAGFDQQHLVEMLSFLWMPADDVPPPLDAKMLAVFRRFDVDGNGYLDESEAQALSSFAFPMEAWDASLWPEMCHGFGAQPARGLDEHQFALFWAAASSAESLSTADATAAREQAAMTRAGGGFAWGAFRLGEEHTAGIPTYILPCPGCKAYQTLLRSDSVLNGGQKVGDCTKCGGSLADLHAKVMTGGDALAAEYGPLIVRGCAEHNYEDGGALASRSPRSGGRGCCDALVIVPSGVCAYWQCPRCPALISDEGAVATDGEAKISKLQSALGG